MGWGANQWLRITKEASYGVHDGDADINNVVWVRLAGDDAFTVRRTPQRVVIRSADSGNRRIQQVASRKAVSGNLQTPWYPSQSAFFLNAALGLNDDVLPSYTLDFFDTVRPRRVLGARVGSLTVGGSAQQDYIPLSIAWVAQKDETLTPFLKPASTVFPTDQPYKHVESKGGLSVGGAVAKFSTLQLTIGNVLVPTWDEDEWITELYYAGRDVDMTLRVQYLAATFRDALEAQTPLAAEAKWTRLTGLQSTFSLKTKNYVATVTDNLPIGGAAYQSVLLQSFFDPAAGTDATFSVA